MGSSPVTATIPSPSGPLADRPEPCRRLHRCLTRELATAGVARGDLLLVAFSGGPDSTALLLALASLAPRHGWRLVAAHVDHRLDPGSAGRAGAAAALADRLGVEHLTLLPHHAEGEPGTEATVDDPDSGPEAFARRLRYRCLERLRERRGARWLLTAHHADDQVETVLLRMLRGSGLAGLAAISPRRAHLLRPLLPLRRAELAAAVAAAGLVPVSDPTNDDLAVPRNLLRRLLLLPGGQQVHHRALALAAAAASARASLAARLSVTAPVTDDPAGPRLELAALRALPVELHPWALAELHRAAGRPFPARRTALAELRRQLCAGSRIGCDCADGWRWESGDGWLWLVPSAPTSEPVAPFAYTLDVPGRVEIREADTTFHLTRWPATGWRERRAGDAGAPDGGGSRRAVMELPLDPGDRVTVRNRRPGDRLQPLGSQHRRRLKDLFIDRRVQRSDRDRIPLLCLGEQVVWVPGVALHDAFRWRPGATRAWVAELTGLGPIGEGK